ncbi:hypothetical protein [Streptomyces sp. NPDC056600]|uniref:hypothetical protein n=1 Tax=Streptomyces sp. NPDC056600 TaxID=3345874 RepID=UPI0036A3474E
MTDSAHTAQPLCPCCDGFAAVTVTLRGRDANGNRRTRRIICRLCSGLGTVRRSARKHAEAVRV